MAFDPENFFTWAVKLNQGESDATEACRRAIVSRAYYGAFLCARRVAQRKKYSGSTGGTSAHHDLAHWFKTNGYSGIGNRLSSCHILRKTADYELEVQVTSKSVSETLAYCRKIFDELKNIP